MDKENIKVAEAVAATTTAIEVPHGGRYLSMIAATAWSGATAQLQIRAPWDATLWIPLGTAATANGSQAIDIPPRSWLRQLITGGPPTGVTNWLQSATP